MRTARTAVFAALAVATGASLACRCIEPGPAAAYRNAQAVVVAQVERIDGDAEGPGGARVQLSVAQAWKAEVAARIEVSTSTTCAYVFEPDRPYLVYLRRDDAGASYLTRRCMGNRPRDEAAAALRWLDRHGRAIPIAAPAR